jgi:hypothetical protein
MAFSHKEDIKNTFVKTVRNHHYYFAYYDSWISGSGGATTANYNYNYNTLLTKTETGRAVEVSTKGVLNYAASNQEH